MRKIYLINIYIYVGKKKCEFCICFLIVKKQKCQCNINLEFFIKVCIYINRYKDVFIKDNFYFDKEIKLIFRLVIVKIILKIGKKEQLNIFVIEINIYFFFVILYS